MRTRPFVLTAAWAASLGLALALGQGLSAAPKKAPARPATAPATVRPAAPAPRASQPGTAPATPATRPAIVPPGGSLDAGKQGTVQYVVLQGDKPGPTVLVTAGLHGNEVAGCRAAEALKDLKLLRGRLVLIPQSNPPALAAKKRLIPGVPQEQNNLNRNFPKKAGEPARGELAAALWAFTEQLRPDWVIDLHESITLRQEDGEGVGSTLIVSRGEAVRKAAEQMRDAVNAGIADPGKHYVVLRSPITGGIARSAADLLGSSAMILETTSPKQPLALRSAQHQTMVKALLRELKMLP